MKRTAALLIGILATGGSAFAASPELNLIVPRGGQTGTTVDVTLTGKRLEDTKEIFSYSPGIRVEEMKVTGATEVTAKFAIAADCPTGEHLFRIRTASGLSYARSFWTGPFPPLEEKEPNSETEEAQPVTAGVTIAGVAKNEDVDYYRIRAGKGDLLSVEIEGIRLGGGFWDPYVAIFDSGMNELAACDDSPLLVQDPWVSLIVPEDGDYLIEIRDSSYAGRDDAFYRAHIGAFPRPSTVYPPGGKPNAELEVHLTGDAGDPIVQPLKTPEKPGEIPVVATRNGISSPSPNPFRVSPLECFEEKEPNNNRRQAEKSPAPAAPVAFFGTLSDADDRDWFRFSAKKDQKFDIVVHARSLRSPLDPVINVFKADGGGLGGNDDNGPNPDSRIGAWTAAEDGEYLLRVRDHLDRGGDDYVYRVEIAPPEASMVSYITRFDRIDSQMRQQMPVPRGNRCAVLVNLDRINCGGDVNWKALNLPPGVALEADTLPNGIGQCPIVFRADADAANAMSLASLVPESADPNAQIPGSFVQKIEFVHGEPNQTPYVISELDSMPVAVVDEVPFSLELVAPTVPVVQSGTMNLIVKAVRTGEFKGPINVRMLWNPPGISSPGIVTIPEGQSECAYPITANGDASTREWKLAVLGESDAGSGQIFASSGLTPVTVAPPYLTMKTEMGSVEQGAEGRILCKLEVTRPFEGKAKVKLVGLPAKTESEEIEIAATDTEAVFPIRTAADSPVGKHQNLFCEAIVMENGVPVPHTIGQGGVLRIDPPPPPDAAVAAAPPKPDDAKPLSRLEQLRKQAADRLANPPPPPP